MRFVSFVVDTPFEVKVDVNSETISGRMVARYGWFFQRRSRICAHLCVSVAKLFFVIVLNVKTS